MDPLFISINPEETGAHIRSLLKQNGFSVRDVQDVMGFENPQAIYKWLSGKSLPKIDNLVILSSLLHTSIDDLLVLNEAA